jgi:small nuclear ribonucleoprotein G
MEKRLFVQLNGNRKVIGILRGYDVFLNIVLDEAVEEKAGGERQRLGMVVGVQTSCTLTQEAKL